MQGNDEVSYLPEGWHAIVDLHGVDIAILSDISRVEKIMCKAAEVGGATILGQLFHLFGTNGGVTGVLMLAESHISIHTWPEHGYAALDVFMCGGGNIEASVNELIRSMEPLNHSVRTLRRE